MATWKEALLNQGLRLLGDPRVAKVMQDERIMRAVMQTAGLPARLQTFTTEQVDRLLAALAVAKEQEVDDLRRTVRRLEEEVARLRREVGGERR